MERDYDFEPWFVSMNHSTGKKEDCRKTTYAHRAAGFYLSTWQLQSHLSELKHTQKRASPEARRLHCHRFTKGAAILEGVIAPFVVQTSRPKRIRIHHDRFRISGRPPSRQE